MTLPCDRKYRINSTWKDDRHACLWDWNKIKWIEKHFDKEKEETFQWRLLFGHNVYGQNSPKVKNDGKGFVFIIFLASIHFYAQTRSSNLWESSLGNIHIWKILTSEKYSSWKIFNLNIYLAGKVFTPVLVFHVHVHHISVHNAMSQYGVWHDIGMIIVTPEKYSPPE